MEAIFQETVRRAAGLGFSSFFLTEEALRRAFSEAAPRDWVEYFSSQSDEIRKQVIDRALMEFGDWLKKIDPKELLETLVAEHDFNVNIQISPSTFCSRTYRVRPSGEIIGPPDSRFNPGSGDVSPVRQCQTR